MKNAKNTKTVKVAKKVTVKKKASNAKQDAATAKAIIEKARPTTVKDHNFLYSFQAANLKAKIKLTHKEEKRLRNKIRRNLKLIVNQIILDNMKKKDTSNVGNFISFYKKEFIMNDFTIKSLTNISDADTIQDYIKVLDLAKEMNKK